MKYLELKGAYRRLDRYAVSFIDKYVSERVRRHYVRIDPLYDRFDHCIIKNDAKCLCRIFAAWKKVEIETNRSITDPHIRSLVTVRNEQCHKIMEKTITSIKETGKVNLKQLNADIRRLYRNES